MRILKILTSSLRLILFVKQGKINQMRLKIGN